MFETILFFAAMGGRAMAPRSPAAIAVAVAAARAHRLGDAALQPRLPIGKFFAYSAVLIAVLAVVLAGKGVAALQEAGMIGVTPLAGLPRSPMLGIYPTLEAMLAQARDGGLAAHRLSLRAAREAPRDGLTLGAALPLGLCGGLILGRTKWRA